MPKYVVQWNYKSSLGGPFVKRDVIEVSEALADAINRDSPGVLEPTPNPSLTLAKPSAKGGGEKKQEAVDPQAIHDRQVKAAETHGRGKQEPMTTENFGAVKPKEE